MNPYDLSVPEIEKLVEQHGTPVDIVGRKKIVDNNTLLDMALPEMHLYALLIVDRMGAYTYSESTRFNGFLPPEFVYID